MTRLMGQEKQRISERIERLDAEREKLSAQLNELEITERVLKRFGGKAGPIGKRGTTRPAAKIARPPVRSAEREGSNRCQQYR